MNKKCYFLILSLAFAFTSSNAAIYKLSGEMDPAQALTNPGNVGSGSGTISGMFDSVSNLLSYSITWQDLTSVVTNMHFHLGAVGVSGGVQLGIPSPWSSPQVGSSILLTDTQETNLLAGNWYFNVHTSQFPAGEIRGQVNVSQVPESGSTFVLASLALLGLVGLRRKLSA